MGNKSKKILSFIAALACLTSSAMFASCNTSAYKGDPVDGFDASAEVSSNGGFAVVKGDYVYFINGMEEYTADNTYGDVVKGALMRISKTDLANRNFSDEAVKTIVPSLFVAQNFDAGIYIYDDCVYYATPTTRKNLDGEVENAYIDFKSAKLDGTAGPMENYYVNLSNNSAKYRFVKAGEGENEAVYLLYEESSALKSYNTKTGVTTTLVSGSSITYYYDTTDPENANVYYTMSVPGLTLDSSSASYNQLYCVNAAATVTNVDANSASYTVSNGKTYTFNKSEMEEKNTEAKEAGNDAVYDFDDYTTYPYVNLGDLVLDGIGINHKLDDNGQTTRTTQYNGNIDSTPLTTDGYTYTITGYSNGGVYFTRTEGLTTDSDVENTKLYYLADSDVENAAWNVVTGNETSGNDAKIDTVALDTTNTGSALFYQQDNAHYYLYISDSNLYRAGYDANGAIEAVRLANGLSSASLLYLNGNYVYYSASGSNGNSISRIDYTGSKEDYSFAFKNTEGYEDYQTVTLDYVDYNSAWYDPEIIGDTLLYSNAQAFGSLSYYYINAAKLGADNATVIADNEAYNAPLENIDSDEYNYNEDLQSVLLYYYYTGETTAYEDVKAEYATELQKAVDSFVAKFQSVDGAEPEYQKISTFTALVGKMTDDDVEAIEESWADSLRSPDDDEDEDEFPGWAIALIIVGSVLVVCVAVGVPLLLSYKKKKEEEKEADDTVNAYKRRIDVTDDKEIDVYSDDEEEVSEQTEETVEDTETEVSEMAEEAETVEETEEEAPAVEEEKKDE